MSLNVEKSFWEKHAKTYQTAFEKLPELADYIHRAERRHLFRVIKPHQEMRVLDLGCGTGRWALEFAPFCRYVLGVDFSEGMIERAREEAKKRNLSNVEFLVDSLETFQTEEKFDLIILSGVLVYFDDPDIQPILQKIANFMNPGALLFSRETVGIHRRIDVQQKFHEKVGDVYSAVYRLPSEYIRFFQNAGLKAEYYNDFVPLTFPMIVYRRLVPASMKQSLWIRKLLAAALAVQYILDPLLLRCKFLYRPIQNRFWEIKSMMFIYRKEK